MRLLYLAAALALISHAPATAADDAPNARAAYAERRGLLEADAQCGLFTGTIRAALQASAAQARGALLRAGWNDAQVRALEAAVVGAARGRRCGDARTEEAADVARDAFARWANAGAMEFPGWDRSWIARRAVASGPTWRLSQEIDSPTPATFGVRDAEGAQRLVLVLPIARPSSAPTTATLVMRDATRARLVEISLPQRMAYGVEAGAPAPNAAARTPSTRTIERVGGQSFAVFTFPDSAFRALLALDPRESVELRLSSGRERQSLYAEVGDVAAARAFLTIR